MHAPGRPRSSARRSPCSWRSCALLASTKLLDVLNEATLRTQRSYESEKGEMAGGQAHAKRLARLRTIDMTIDRSRYVASSGPWTLRDE